MEFSIYAELKEEHTLKDVQVIDWGIQLVQAPKVWSMTKGEGMKIAILDTGVDLLHPDLQANIVKGKNFTTENPADYIDRQGHGTHCAGVVAGVDNGIGVVGVAPSAKLYIAKVLGDDGRGSIQPIIDAIYWAIEQEVDIISLSLGASSDPGPSLHEAIIKAREAGIVIVAASGNENTNVSYPAVYDEVISVGAVDQTFGRADFSNYGQELDVVAPGVDILSTYIKNGYATLSGTSMATPLVAGVVALVQAYARQNNLKATPEKIVELINERSIDMGDQGRDDMFGNGLINVFRLLKGNNDGLR